MTVPMTESPTMRSGYQRGWHRMLVDMEIPGWDESFLADYDPVAMADLYRRAGASSVMFSCKNLSGLCFWPTTVGTRHPRTADRDLVGETVAALRERHIAGCLYYSVIFDNAAYEAHPEWRAQPLLGAPAGATPWGRHGLCCPNSEGYRSHVDAELTDLVERYDLDCVFCDMSFWPGVCVCHSCRERFRAETGAEIPDVVDWTAEPWCAFQTARERWIADFQRHVTDSARRARPDVAVYHNFAPGPVHWTLGVPFAVTEHSDFLGGDLYGDFLEQLVVTRLMNNLSRSRPVEYMTFGTVGTEEHVRIKTPQQLRTQVLAATAESSAVMFIDAIDPVGTANPGLYDRVHEAFASARGFEPYLGGEPVEDVAVYFSSDSKMSFAENGKPTNDPALLMPEGYPHLSAVRGMCRVLQRAHLPFGVVTRRQLGELDRYRVLVLPNVLRMDADEVEAVRDYVRRGGCVYASGYTSLVETRGVRHDDFMLADVFGAHLDREEETGMVYATPVTAEATERFEPQRHLSSHPEGPGLAGGLLRLRAEPGADVHATLTLPYAHPVVGSVDDQNWSSIHSFPPHEDTGAPALVEHRYGAGRVVYSAFDMEREEADANDRVLSWLVGSLLGDGWSVQCDTHPDVSVSAFHDTAAGTVRLSLLNSPPALVPGATLRVRPPAGARFTTLELVPAGDAVPFTAAPDGTIEFTLRDLQELTMVVAGYRGGEQVTDGR